MKRKLAAVLAVCMVLLCLPARAAGDGVNWRTPEPGQDWPSYLSYEAALGKYRFVYEQGGYYLAGEDGARIRLTAMDAAWEQKGLGCNNFHAYYVPGGVRLVTYGRYDTDGTVKFEHTYTEAELDALLAKPPAPEAETGAFSV